MNWTGYPYKGFLHSLRSHQGAGRKWGRLLRRVGRGTRSVMRTARPRRERRGCCCCPAFLLLGLAGMGLVAGLFYAGIRFLPLIL